MPTNERRADHFQPIRRHNECHYNLLTRADSISLLAAMELFTSWKLYNTDVWTSSIMQLFNYTDVFLILPAHTVDNRK